MIDTVSSSCARGDIAMSAMRSFTTNVCTQRCDVVQQHRHRNDRDTTHVREMRPTTGVSGQQKAPEQVQGGMA
jgi:hypothetical protein